jgi:hypothetical protein
LAEEGVLVEKGALPLLLLLLVRLVRPVLPLSLIVKTRKRLLYLVTCALKLVDDG